MPVPPLPAVLDVLDRAAVLRDRPPAVQDEPQPVECGRWGRIPFRQEHAQAQAGDLLLAAALSAGTNHTPAELALAVAAHLAESSRPSAPSPAWSIWNRPATSQERAEREAKLAQDLRRVQRSRTWLTEDHGTVLGAFMAVGATFEAMNACFAQHAPLAGFLSLITLPPMFLLGFKAIGAHLERCQDAKAVSVLVWEYLQRELTPVVAETPDAPAWAWWDRWQTHPEVATQAKAWARSEVGLLMGDVRCLNARADHLDRQPVPPVAPEVAPEVVTQPSRPEFQVSEATLRTAQAFCHLARTATGPFTRGPLAAQRYAAAHPPPRSWWRDGWPFVSRD